LPSPAKGEPAASPTLHIALMEAGFNLEFHLDQFFRNQPVSFHFFEDLESLFLMCQRFPIDVIVMGGRSGFYTKELDLLRGIKGNVFLSIIPVILYHPEPPQEVVIAAFENGAEDFIHGEWLDKLVEVRIRRAIARSRRDLAVNPTTRLPGPASIEREINHQLRHGFEFALAYADLDNFKAYNDYYGYYYGDGVIKLTARIIKDVVFDLCREGFVGHIAGDDFLFVIPQELVEEICPWIIRTFDAIIPYRYHGDDRERGHITTADRSGNVQEFPILSMSIAVVINRDGQFHHIGEVSKMMADLKRATKQRPGSNYMVERRAKY
jgi:GGDEF domain-containing protein